MVTLDTPATSALRRLTGCTVIVFLENVQRKWYIKYAEKHKEKYKLKLRTDINMKPILWLAGLHNIMFYLVRYKEQFYGRAKKWFKNNEPKNGSKVVQESLGVEAENFQKKSTRKISQIKNLTQIWPKIS